VRGPRRLAAIYERIGRTLWSKAASLLILATILFVPIGFLDALTTSVDVDSFDFASGLEILAVVGATAAIAMTGLLGEVFFSGAVAVSLTHPEGERAPSLRQVARRLDFRRLILVDLVYVALVIVGLLLLFVPGILVFVWFGLAGPVVELEGRGVRGALRRSAALVRGSFWLVLLVLGPVELVGDVGAEAVGHGVHSLLGHSLFANWMAESVSNIAFSPLFAVAAVLLTLELIERRDPRPAAAAVSGSSAPTATRSR
jgi:hypothetical protein